MPGPLTTVQRVRDLGGLIDSAPTGSLGSANWFAHNLFGYPDDTTLVTRINTEIALASSWLQSRAGTDYASGDPIKDALFAEAEAYIALRALYKTLEMRKVLGIHWPLASEEGKSFEELIEVEMPEHIKTFIDAYLTVEEGKPWAAPAMAISGPIDRTQPTFKGPVDQLQDVLDESEAVAVPILPISTDGQRNTL